MKKFLFVSLLCCLTLVACAGGNNNQSQTESKEEVDVMKITENENGTRTVSYNFGEQDFTNADKSQPFLNKFPSKEVTATLGGSTYVADIAYKKDDSGTFIYCNNPEALMPEDIGVALMRDDNLTGDCVFTYEHGNRTGIPIILGYQLKNTGDTDAVVTVTNVGLQVEGEWLGQREWSDFYNLGFTLPDDYFTENGEVNPIYVGCDYVKYTPAKVYEPQTVTVPVGESIYVLGGTTTDAYNNTNIGGTADRMILAGKCANGVVKFRIEGSMCGTFYCYTNVSQVAAEPKEQGFIVTRNGVDFGRQYKGIDRDTIGHIEADIVFFADDSTKSGVMPVTYTLLTDPNYSSVTTPYTAYNLVEKTIRAGKWMTSLNPVSSPTAVGTDMINFECRTTDGETVIIDSAHSDGMGDPANTGNWMVMYTDYLTFVNTGEKTRTFKIFKRNNGCMTTIVRDDTGKVLETAFKCAPYSFGSLDEVFSGVDSSLLVQKNGRYWFKVADGRPYCDVIDERSFIYEVKVEPGKAERVSVDYVILANSNGSIVHWIETDTEE